jgi:hypothetical protein
MVKVQCQLYRYCVHLRIKTSNAEFRSNVDHVPVSRAVHCVQDVTVGKCTLRKMHEI